jgi:hypothetical protein
MAVGEEGVVRIGVAALATTVGEVAVRTGVAVLTSAVGETTVPEEGPQPDPTILNMRNAKKKRSFARIFPTLNRSIAFTGQPMAWLPCDQAL